MAFNPEGIRTFWSAAPDGLSTVTEQFEVDDRVVVAVTFSGTPQGDLGGHAPTGRGFEVDGVADLRVREGRIAEQRIVWDALGFHRQLGLPID
ncbi:MAG: ester cyclase [Sporichthyaceae bacterium]